MTNYKGFILTFIVSLCIFNTLSNMLKNKIVILHYRSKKELRLSIIIGILFGAVWGGEYFVFCNCYILLFLLLPLQ